MTTLSGIPGFQKAAEKLADGKSTSAGEGRRDFLTLPFDQEFRVEILDATAVKSQAGNDGLRYKLEIVEDCTDDQRYVGQWVWGSVYFTGHEFQGQQLATLHASVGSPPASTLEQLAQQIGGGKLVIALKENDQNPQYPQIRYMNVDRGQALNAKVKAPKTGGKSTPDAIKADISTIREQRQQAPAAAAPAPAPVVEEPTPVPPVPTTVAPKAAPSAPGGLRLPGQ